MLSLCLAACLYIPVFWLLPNLPLISHNHHRTSCSWEISRSIRNISPYYYFVSICTNNLALPFSMYCLFVNYNHRNPE
ncbi:hypothetical protein F4859DRAFT_495963 [Xylaria cf. heliscus]|nr:hypothetical protein F4859DRAFT_495963 [Xylaria cf. heliscus]